MGQAGTKLESKFKKNSRFLVQNIIFPAGAAALLTRYILLPNLMPDLFTPMNVLDNPGQVHDGEGLSFAPEITSGKFLVVSSAGEILRIIITIIFSIVHCSANINH